MSATTANNTSALTITNGINRNADKTKDNTSADDDAMLNQIQLCEAHYNDMDT